MRRESSLGFLLAVVANVSAPLLPFLLLLTLSLSFTVQSIWLCFLLLLATAAAAAAQQIFVIPDKHHLLLAACGPRPKLRL